MSPTRPRDSYKARVIAATGNVPSKLLNPSDLQHLMDRLLKSSWAQKHLIHRTRWGLYLNAGPYCRCTRPAIMTDIHLMHHVAHFMTPVEVAEHGPEYCRNFIEAVRKWVGADEAAELRTELKVQGAKLRSWSPEARERAKQRHAERSFGSAHDELKAMLAELEAE
jgi:hypothetical protein